MAVDDAYTKSLLHFQNRVWTFAGTAQIDTAQHPFTSGGSLLLDGDSDYIYSTNSSDFAFGTGNFTVDFWFRPASVTGDHCLFDTRSYGGAGDGFVIHHDGTSLRVFSGGTGVITGASTLLVDTWYHCALVGESGATVKLYLDGTQEGSTWTVAYNFTNDDCVVGKAMDVANYYFSGHISEFRITKGLARWTADFSASLPTAKYADDVQDPILGTWNPSDKSASVTLSNGNLTATNAGASWSSARSTVGKSSGKWYWEYTIASLGYVEVGAGIATSALDGRFVNPWGTGWGGQSNTAGFGAGDVVQVAIDIDGGNIWVGKNGTWNGSGNPSTGANPYQTGVSGTIYPMVTVYAAEATVNLGASTFQYQPPVGFNGLHTVSLLHFDEADGSTFTKDVAANWTMDGAAQFYDESGKVWTVTGDAQLDTAQKKWVASGLFDGSDSIDRSSDSDLSFGTGAFTIDFWFRLSSLSGSYDNVLDNRQSLENSVNSFTVSLTKDAGTGFMFGQGLGYSYFAAPFVADTWYHMAVVGNGGADGERTIKVYVDGQLSLGCTVTTNYNINRDRLMIGNAYDGNGLKGWIEELRISKGIARWTSDFTPPTVEYCPTTAAYAIPALTDTDSALAPSINHVFPIPATDTDSFLVPSINHVFPIPISDTDTMVAPKYNIVLKMPVYLTDSDTVVAPYFGRTIPLTSTLTDTDIPLSLRIEGIPVPRHRVKVNY